MIITRRTPAPGFLFHLDSVVVVYTHTLRTAIEHFISFLSVYFANRANVAESKNRPNLHPSSSSFWPWSLLSTILIHLFTTQISNVRTKKP